jgi:hypothetical protein
MVHEASLTLLFERNWIGKELHPALDLDPGQKGPIIRTRSDTNLPGYVDLSAFWHSDEGWRSDETMHPSADVSSPLFDAYTWSRRNFSGIARVSWDPAMNYHTKRPRLQSAQRRPNAPSKGA